MRDDFDDEVWSETPLPRLLICFDSFGFFDDCGCRMSESMCTYLPRKSFFTSLLATGLYVGARWSGTDNGAGGGDRSRECDRDCDRRCDRDRDREEDDDDECRCFRRGERDRDRVRE